MLLAISAGSAPTDPAAAPSTSTPAPAPAPAEAEAHSVVEHQYTPADAEAVFKSANEAYDQDHLEQSIQGYERLVSDGYGTADVQYNLGNAYFRLGKAGKAVLAYERARRLDPSDEDAQANLEKVRRELVDKVTGQTEEPLLDRLSSLMSAQRVAVLFLAAYALLWFGILSRRFLHAGAWSTVLIVVGAIASLPTGALMGVQLYQHDRAHEAVVLASTVPVREGPSKGSKVSFEVHEGTTLRVLDHEGSFLRVKLRNNLEGWADSESITEI
jgi:tetratricopeptide (TPR) repeat protein